MLCIREVVFFKFCQESDFLSRSQVDDMVSFLACEHVTDCTLHTARLPSAVYCVRLRLCYLCCTEYDFYHERHTADMQYIDKSTSTIFDCLSLIMAQYYLYVHCMLLHLSDTVRCPRATD